MKTKKFRGLVIGIEDASFSDAEGEVISGARLKMMLTEEKGLNIFISEKRDKKVFGMLPHIDEGVIVDLTVNVDINNDGKLKYIPLELALVEDATSDVD